MVDAILGPPPLQYDECDADDTDPACRPLSEYQAEPATEGPAFIFASGNPAAGTEGDRVVKPRASGP